MKEIFTEIIIQAPKERVWEILTRFEAYPQWNPFIVKAEGRAKPGDRLNISIQLRDKLNHFRPKISSLQKGEAFEWLGSLPLGLFKGNHYFKLESLDDGRVKLKHGERFSGLLSGYILKKVGEDTKAGFIAMNEALKKRVEQREMM